jgi:hypothetical protein
MSQATKTYYAMFSDFGNEAVDEIVRNAKVLKMDWAQVENELFNLTVKFPSICEEANDTSVREAVYIALYGLQ